MLLDVVDAVGSVLRPEEGSWTGAAENGGVGNKEGRGSLGEYGVLWVWKPMEPGVRGPGEIHGAGSPRFAPRFRVVGTGNQRFSRNIQKTT